MTSYNYTTVTILLHDCIVNMYVYKWGVSNVWNGIWTGMMEWNETDVRMCN